MNKAFADLGKIDVVVNNAGYGLFGAATDLSSGKDFRPLAVAAQLMGAGCALMSSYPPKVCEFAFIQAS